MAVQIQMVVLVALVVAAIHGTKQQVIHFLLMQPPVQQILAVAVVVETEAKIQNLVRVVVPVL